MEPDARRRLIKKALVILDEGSTLLAVNLNDFFEDNTDERSIGINLLDDQHIGLAAFRRLFMAIRDRPDVQDVFIELTEIPDPDDEQDDGIWPSASAAFVVTSASLADVSDWMAELHPRDVCEGWCVVPGVKTPISEGELHNGMRPVRVWLL